MEIYTDFVAKAISFSLTKRAKRLRSSYNGIDNEAYKIAPGLPITVPHLLCVLLYTNHTQLQYHFKKYGTRFNERASSFTELKKYNAKIGWWYNYLCQSVLFYGSLSNSKTDTFYHGLSTKLLFPHFNPTFRAPISTTTDIEIARRFATEDGLILVLEPSPNSDDRYLDVSWLSCYPKEEERLFFIASDLRIHDLRYDDPTDGLRLGNENYRHIKPMRLLGEIFLQKSYYTPNLLKPSIQKTLIKYIKEVTNSRLENILEWNDDQGFDHLNEFLLDEEYDTDCIEIDIWDEVGGDDVNEEGSNIYKMIEDAWIDFEEFCGNNIKPDLPRYLRELFGNIAYQISLKPRIPMIKSEYEDKLNPELQSALKLLCNKSDVVYTNELEWVIEGEDFKELLEKNIGDEFEGPPQQCEILCIDDEGISQGKTNISIVPILHLKDPSFPDYCSFGIELIDIGDAEDVTLYWTFSIEEIDYSRGRSEYLYKVEEGEYDGVKSFKNELITEDLEKLTVKISIY